MRLLTFSRVAVLSAGLVLLSAAGCKDATGGNDSAAVVWESQTGGGFIGMPTVGDGRVYTIGGGGGVYALDVQTGTRLWQNVGPRGGEAEALLFRAGRVYAAQIEVARVLDAATGNTVWERAFEGQESPDFTWPAVDEAAFYVGTRDGRVLALDVSDGSMVWERQIAPEWQYTAIPRGISISGDTVYVSVMRDLDDRAYVQHGVLFAYDRRSGAELWRYEVTDGINGVIGPPVVSGPLLITSDRRGNSVFAVDRFTRQEVWRVRGGATFAGPHAPPVVIGDTVYLGMVDTRVYAVQRRTGQTIWSTATRASVIGVGVCGDVVVANNNDLELVDRRTGRYRGMAMRGTESEFALSGVVSAGGRAFVAGTSKMYALRCS